MRFLLHPHLNTKILYLLWILTPIMQAQATVSTGLETQMSYLEQEKKINEIKYSWVTLTELADSLDPIKQACQQHFGADNCLSAHLYNQRVISENRMLRLYEDSYYQYLQSNPSIRQWLQDTASEVFVNDKTDIVSGLDFSHQESAHKHFQDIAVRRALTRLQLEDDGTSYRRSKLPTLKIFRGKELIHIGGSDSKGFSLQSGQVPFCDSSLSLKPLALDKDVKPGSVEDVLQRSQVLLLNPKVLQLGLVTLTADTACLHLNHRWLFRHHRRDRLSLTLVDAHTVEQEKTKTGVCNLTCASVQPFRWIQTSIDLCHRYSQSLSAEMTFEELIDSVLAQTPSELTIDLEQADAVLPQSKKEKMPDKAKRMRSYLAPTLQTQFIFKLIDKHYTTKQKGNLFTLGDHQEIRTLYDINNACDVLCLQKATSLCFRLTTAAPSTLAEKIVYCDIIETAVRLRETAYSKSM